MSLTNNTAIIDYRPPPTIEAFILDYKPADLFYSWIIGPVGSGKTTGIFFKLIYMASLQAPSKDGIRRTKAVIVRNCFDDQTEILTEKRGWRLFRDLIKDGPDADKVAMLDGDKTVFVEPTLHYQAPYKGKMLGCQTQNLDYLVTPDHNMWAAVVNGRTKERSTYRAEHAQALHGKTNREFRAKGGEWEGVTDLTPAMFEVLGIWAADGHAKIPNGLPLWIKHAPPEHLRAFMRGYAMGDGEIKEGPHSVTRLRTSSRQVADDLQEIAFLMGDAATVTSRTHTWEAGSQRWGRRIETTTETTEYAVTLLTDARQWPQPQKKDSFYDVDYDGEVYCVEVPTHIVYVRRNGKTFWCMQTMPQLKDTTLASWGYWFKEGEAGDWNATDKIFTLRWADCECEVLFRPLDSPDDVSRVLSLEVNFAIFDEFVQIHMRIIEAMSARLGRFKFPDGTEPTVWGMWGSSNPSTEDNAWFDYLHNDKLVERIDIYQPGNDPLTLAARRGISGDERNVRYFVQPSGLSASAENLNHLPGGRKYYTNQIIGKSIAWIKQFIEAEWGFSAAGKPVVASFKPEMHISKTPLQYNRHLPLVAGVDPGLAGSSFIFGQEDHGGRLNVLGECVQAGYGTRRLITEVVKPYVRRRFPDAQLLLAPDPAANNRAQNDERTAVSIMKEYWPCTIESNNRLPLRLDAIEYFTTKLVSSGPAFQIDPWECPVTVRALKGGWRFELNVSKDDMIRGAQPEKNSYSHPGDGLGYLCRYFHKRAGRELQGGQSDRRFTPPKFSNNYIWR
jgi:hypothetical protein